MGALGQVGVTPGAGAEVAVVVLADGKELQLVRTDRANASTRDAWPVVTTAAASRIPADFNRVSLIIFSNANGRVYLRHDGTAPTTATDGYDVVMEPGAAYQVPYEMVALAVSFLGTTPGGHVVSRMGTNA